MSILDGLTSKQSGAVRHTRRHIRLGEGEVLFHEGEAARSLYVIIKGRIEVSKTTSKGRIILAHLGGQEVLGEIGILTDDGRRTATARALEPTDVLEIPNNPVSLFRQLGDRQATIRILENLFWVIARRLYEFDRRAERSEPVASGLSSGAQIGGRKALAAIQASLPKRGIFWRMAELHRMEAGSYLFRQGEPSDGFYLLRSGTVQVLKENPRGNSNPLGKMTAPCIVGEIGYFSGRRRSASVRCVSRTDYHFFPAEKFEELRQTKPAEAMKVIFAAAQLAVFLLLERERLPVVGRKSPR